MAGKPQLLEVVVIEKPRVIYFRVLVRYGEGDEEKVIYIQCDRRPASLVAERVRVRQVFRKQEFVDYFLPDELQENFFIPSDEPKGVRVVVVPTIPGNAPSISNWAEFLQFLSEHPSARTGKALNGVHQGLVDWE